MVQTDFDSDPPTAAVDSSPVFDLDGTISFFRNVTAWADANGHGNSHGVLLRITRDLETLRALPPEAFEPPEPIEVDTPPETEVNSAAGPDATE